MHSVSNGKVPNSSVTDSYKCTGSAITNVLLGVIGFSAVVIGITSLSCGILCGIKFKEISLNSNKLPTPIKGNTGSDDVAVYEEIDLKLARIATSENESYGQLQNIGR